MLEPWLTILALAVILGYGRLGWIFGLFAELANSLILFLAMLVSLRYWRLADRYVSWLLGDSTSNSPAIAFWALLAVTCFPMVFLLQGFIKKSRPSYPYLLDRVLGFILGTVSATIVFSCVMLSLSVFQPALVSSHARSTMLVRWDVLPIAVYCYIERDCLSIDRNDPLRTRFPVFSGRRSGPTAWR